MKLPLTEQQFLDFGRNAQWIDPVFCFAPEEEIFLDVEGKEQEMAAQSIKNYESTEQYQIEGVKLNNEIATKILKRTRFFYVHFCFHIGTPLQNGEEFNPYLVCSMLWSFGGQDNPATPSLTFTLFEDEQDVLEFISESALIYEPKTHQKTLFAIESLPDSSDTPLDFNNIFSMFYSWAFFAKEMYFAHLKASKSYICDFKDIGAAIRKLQEVDKKEKAAIKKPRKPRKKKIVDKIANKE